MLARLICVLVLAHGGALSQTPFPLAEVAEIGMLGTESDGRELVDLGMAEAIPDDASSIRIEGHDDQGDPWRLWLPTSGAYNARLRVYQADLNGDGRRDLLFSDVGIGNGRCVGDGTVITLIFDSAGRPVPWIIPTRAMIQDDGNPVLLVDLNGDGRAEIITSDCEYALRQELYPGEDRWITGIYEARDTIWTPIRPPSLEPYLQAIKRRFPEIEPGYLEWVAAPAPLSPDPLEGWGERPWTKLTGVLMAEIGCESSEAVEFDRAGTGILCTDMELSNRTRYADGSVRTDWPFVVLDSAAGREIHFAHRREALEKVLAAGFPVRVLGPGIESSILWTDANSEPQIRPVNLSLRTRVVRSKALKLADARVETPVATGVRFELNPDGPAGTGATGQFFRFVPAGSDSPVGRLGKGNYFSRRGNCFFMPISGSNYDTVHILDDCKELSPLNSEADSGARVLLNPAVGLRRVILPETRTFRVLEGFRWPFDKVRRELTFQHVPGHPGEMIGVVSLGAFWLVQWERSGETWLSIHGDDGEALSKALKNELNAELFDGDGEKGIEFVRWADEVPWIG